MNTTAASIIEMDNILRRQMNGLVKFQNMGNTCYLNSVMQVLLNIPKFRTYFLSKNYYIDLINVIKRKNLSLDETNNMTKILDYFPNMFSFQFERLCKLVWHDGNTVPLLRPITFKNIISKKYNDFNNYEQQDVQECISAIFDIIENEIGYSVVVDPEFTQDEHITFQMLDSEFDEISKMCEGEDKTYRRATLRVLEDNSPGLIKRYKQLLNLRSKYEKKYSICDELFSFGQINTLECSYCKYKSHTYDISTCLFVEIPDIKITELEIEERKKTIILPFEAYDTKEESKAIEDNSSRPIIIDTSTQNNGETKISIFDDNDNSQPRKDTSSDDLSDTEVFLNDRDDDFYNLTKKLNEELRERLPKMSDFKPRFTIEQIDQIKRVRAIDMIQREREIKLEDCLNSTFKLEKIDIQLTCNYCQEKNDIIKNNTLWALPQYLIIQLKRFDIMNNIKKQNLIKFPGILDMAKYMDPDLSKHLKTDTKYNLINVINHIGTLNNGHYYSYCKNSNNGLWYLMNDDKISFCDQLITPEAYMLIYEKLE